MRNVVILGMFISCAAALGCRATPSASRARETEILAASVGGSHLCPLSVPGARARVSDVPGGVALELTTDVSAESVAELRRRARRMADQGQLGTMAGPGGGVGSRGRERDANRVARTGLDAIITEDIPNGFRLMIMPELPRRIDALRARARAHAEKMAANPACARK